MHKYRSFILTALVGLVLTMTSGCSLDAIFSLIDPGTILNLASLGQVDLAGQQNWFLPDGPDYDKDPTCTLPGMCGPNIYYPTSTAP